MLETCLQENRFPRPLFFISSADLYRIITLPFLTLTWYYIGQVHPPALLETMAAGEQGLTPRHKPTLLLFIDFCQLCLDLI